MFFIYLRGFLYLLVPLISELQICCLLLFSSEDSCLLFINSQNSTYSLASGSKGFPYFDYRFLILFMIYFGYIVFTFYVIKIIFYLLFVLKLPAYYEYQVVITTSCVVVPLSDSYIWYVCNLFWCNMQCRNIICLQLLMNSLQNNIK
jgi:hypothetical protein